MHVFFQMVGFAGVSHRTETLVGLALLLAGIGLAVALARHPFWGGRLRATFRRPWVALAALVATGFFLIAWMDAVAWKDTVPSGESGKALQATEPRSLLDRLFAKAVGVPEYEFRERSYSAPLATHEFVDREIEYNNLTLAVLEGVVVEVISW